MDKRIRNSHLSSLEKRRPLTNLNNNNKENIQNSVKNISLLRSLRSEIINLKSMENSDRPSSKLNVAKWSSFLSIDATMLDFESQLMNLVDTIDQRMFQLVLKTNEEYNMKSKDKVIAKEVEKLREKAESSWEWIENLTDLIKTHFSNASKYHLFHQKLLEYKIQLPQIGFSERNKMEKENFEGNYEEANSIYLVTKDHLNRFLRWWRKIEEIIIESRKLKPLGLRTRDFDFKRSAKMLINYRDKDDRELMPHENVMVSRKGSNQRWKIEKPSLRLSTSSDIDEIGPNNSSLFQMDHVPSICVELDPPDIGAIERALLLRLDLLASWTTALREIGSCLMSYIATVLGYWSDIDISNLTGKNGNRKENVSKSLDTIETLLRTYWSNSDQFLSLQNQISILKSELEIQAESDIEQMLDETQIDRNTMFIKISPKTMDEIKPHNAVSRSETFKYQKRAILILVNKYKDLHKYWDEYRKLVEGATELQLICDIRNTKENLIEHTVVPDELLSYLSSDDQQGWNKYLNLLSEKFRHSSHNVSRATSTMSLYRPPSHHNHPGNHDHSIDKGPLINVLPQELELTSRTEQHDYRTGRQKSQLDLSVPAEKEINFFKNQQHKINKKPTTNNIASIKKVDISNYYTNSLLPQNKRSNTLSTTRRNSIVESETEIRSVPKSRFSTMPISITSLYDQLQNTPRTSQTPDTYTSPKTARSNRSKTYFFPAYPNNSLPNQHTSINNTIPHTRYHTISSNSDHEYRPVFSAVPQSTNLLKHKFSTLPPNLNRHCTMSASFTNPNTPLLHNKSNTLKMSQVEDLEKIQLIRNKECVQSCYLVATVPIKDRIESILDKRQQIFFDPEKALENHLTDPYYLQILDTLTNTKIPFNLALSQGYVKLKTSQSNIVDQNNKVAARFISLTSNNRNDTRSRSSSGDLYEKIVFKVDAILDPDRSEWISLKEASQRSLLSIQSGMLKLDQEQHYEHIVLAINQSQVQAKRLYHCKTNSLPPEMTVELSK